MAKVGVPKILNLSNATTTLLLVVGNILCLEVTRHLVRDGQYLAASMLSPKMYRPTFKRISSHTQLFGIVRARASLNSSLIVDSWIVVYVTGAQKGIRPTWKSLHIISQLFFVCYDTGIRSTEQHLKGPLPVIVLDDSQAQGNLVISPVWWTDVRRIRCR